MQLDVVELFAGVGGFRVGLNKISSIGENNRAIETGKWNFVWANQFEPSTKKQHAFECYIRRFGENSCSNEDINNVNIKNVPAHSLLVGGFPCQDYSVARSISGEKGIEGKKGVLFWNIKKFLEEKDTTFVLLENVDRLLKSPSVNRGRDFAIMLKTFCDLGYNVQWRVINAADYSMPQKRKRVFMLAYKKNTAFSNSLSNADLNTENIFNKVFPIHTIKKFSYININKYINVLDVSERYNDGKFLECGIMYDGKIIHTDVKVIEEEKYKLSDILNSAKLLNGELEDYIISNEKLERWRYLKGSKTIERVSKTGYKYFYSEGAMSFPDNLNEPARTILTSEGSVNRSSHIVFDENIKNYRALTPIECELIQMFPANWTDTMNKRKRYFVMGNALVTGIISRIEPVIRKIIESE